MIHRSEPAFPLLLNMTNRLEIPGYYYGTPTPPASLPYHHPADTPTDESKAKYFKIQASHTAPASSPYSSELVKRRRLEDTKLLEAETARKLRRKHIKRSGLENPSSVAGLLSREQNVSKCYALDTLFAGNLSESAVPLESAATGAGVTALDYDPITKALFYGKHIFHLSSRRIFFPVA